MTFLKTLNEAFNKHDGWDSDELKPSVYLVARFDCVKIVLVDDVLGLHQPLLQVFLDSVEICLSTYSAQHDSMIDHEAIEFHPSKLRRLKPRGSRASGTTDVNIEILSDFMLFINLTFLTTIKHI